MATPAYSGIPTLAKWQADSSVALAIRKDDRILTHIDWLVERYNFHTTNGNDSIRTAIVADLFFTLNTWVKLFHQKHPNLKPGRYPAIMALFAAVVELLCIWLGCRQSELSQQLSFMFGAALTDGGHYIDQIQNKARYFDRMERRVYRLHFKNGMVYQYPWWNMRTYLPQKPGDTSMPPLRLQPADSIHAHEPGIARMGYVASPGYGTYVCTLEREFFMTKPYAGGAEQTGIYHSSYTAGGPVTGAGSMLIERGVVKGIRDDSGHYQPGAQNMTGILQALGMYGVRLSKVHLLSWKNAEPLGTALDFLKSNLSWVQFLDQRDKQKAHQDNRYPENWGTVMSSNAPAKSMPATTIPQNPGGTGPYFTN